MRCLGVDPGGRRLGLAVGDELTGVVTPLAVLRCSGAREAAELIAAAVQRHQAELVVIGMPCRDDGSRTPACARSEAIAARLGELGLQVAFQNELLSTDEARRRARAAGLRHDQEVDHFAAQVLLEDFLSRRGGRPGGSP